MPLFDGLYLIEKNGHRTLACRANDEWLGYMELHPFTEHDFHVIGRLDWIWLKEDNQDETQARSQP